VDSGSATATTVEPTLTATVTAVSDRGVTTSTVVAPTVTPGGVASTPDSASIATTGENALVTTGPQVTAGTAATTATVLDTTGVPEELAVTPYIPSVTITGLSAGATPGVASVMPDPSGVRIDSVEADTDSTVSITADTAQGGADAVTVNFGRVSSVGTTPSSTIVQDSGTRPGDYYRRNR
jgi:hypothetical protein